MGMSSLNINQAHLTKTKFLLSAVQASPTVFF